jgi:hypothetical protein
VSGATIDRELRAANPLAPDGLAALDLGAGEAALGAALFAEPPGAPESRPSAAPASGRPRSPRRNLLAGALAVAVTAAVLLLAGGPASPTPAYSARLTRYTESTPPLLLEAPGWRLRSAGRLRNGGGTMEFVADDPGPGGRIELTWHEATPSRLLRLSFGGWAPARGATTAMPALGTTVYVDASAATARGPGGPAEREMAAVWREGSRVLELRAAVPGLAALRERLGWLRRAGG